MTLVAAAGLPQVVWDGLALNDEADDGTTAIVEDLDGWYGTAEIDAADADRTLVDGAVAGPKVVKARDLTLTGVAVAGTRAGLIALHDALAGRVAAAAPTVMTVADPFLGEVLRAEVRATGRMTQTWLGPLCFRYSLGLRAVDPRKYSLEASTVVLTSGHQGGTGRTYPRHYREGATTLTVTARRGHDPHQVTASAAPDGAWHYAGAFIPNRATLANRGSAPAPVQAVYTGPLSESRLSDGTSYIVVAALPAGMTLTVDTRTLAATAPGGYSRAAYLLGGSQPLLVPPHSTTPWSLYVTSGTGNVTLTWRSAWW